MSLKQRSLGWPEKIFAGYAGVMVLLFAGIVFRGDIGCLIVFEVLLLPVGWLLEWGSWYSNLPNEFAYPMALLAVLANGAIFYAAIKFLARKRMQAAVLTK